MTDDIHELKSRISALEYILAQTFVLSCYSSSGDPLTVLQGLRSMFDAKQDATGVPADAPARDTAGRIFDSVQYTVEQMLAQPDRPD